MATKYPHPITVDVWLGFRNFGGSCCEDGQKGNPCNCGPLLNINIEVKTPVAVMKQRHWLEVGNIWGAKHTLKENYYHDDYVRTGLGR